MTNVLLEAQDVKKHFPITKGLAFARQVGTVKAVDGVSFQIQAGETFGLVGESGCGKTTISMLVLLLERITAGRILFDGKDMQTLSGKEVKRYRKAVQAVFQDPYSSLSPRMKVAEIVGEPLVVHEGLPGREISHRVRQLLEIVGINPAAADLYPHEFSGGQRQRIAIARALAVNPRLIVLDEPVSALDVSIRAQVMNLLRDIQDEFGLTYLFIAHDLGVVKHMSNKVGVMYLGRLVETAPSKELHRNPLHPYTQALLSAALAADPDLERREIVLSGEVPSPLRPPSGCRFHTRCQSALARCSEEEPAWLESSPGHMVACHLY